MENNIGTGYDALTKGTIKARLDLLETKVTALEAKAAYWVGQGLVKVGDIGSTAAVLPVQGIITSASKQGGY